MIGSLNFIKDQDVKSNKSETFTPNSDNVDSVADSASFSDNNSRKYLQVSDLDSKPDPYDSGFSSRASTVSNSPEDSPCPSETANRACKAAQLDKSIDLVKELNKNLKEKEDIDIPVHNISGLVGDSLAEPMSSIESSFATLDDSGQSLADDFDKNSAPQLKIVVLGAEDQCVVDLEVGKNEDSCENISGDDSGIVTHHSSGEPLLDKSASSSIQYLESDDKSRRSSIQQYLNAEPVINIEPSLTPDRLEVQSAKRVEFNISDESLAESLEEDKTFQPLTEENLKLLEKNEEAKKKKEAEEGCTPKNTIYLILRLLRIFLCLFFFICSLDLLSSSFQLLGGKTAGTAFQNSELLKNPICGLMIGVVSTAVLQSSSTSTSIVTTMVASGLLTVPMAIPIIMGANIGTSITGVIVSVTQAGDSFVFRRAFSAATVHDTFNWLTVFVLLPIEIASGLLHRLTGLIIDRANLAAGQGSKQEFLKVLTKPITKMVVQLNKNVLTAIATGGSVNVTLLKDCSGTKHETVTDNTPTGVNKLDNISPDPIPEASTSNLFWALDAGLGTSEESVVISTDDQMNRNLSLVSPLPTMIAEGKASCWYIFKGTALSDQAVGGLVLLIAVILLLLCLTFMVRDLKALLAGHMAKVIQRKINADFPGKCGYFTGYAFILLGAILTILVQSSSVVVSTLTPLVGVEFVRLERVFPMMLGANLGTTSTAIVAAFASTGNKIKPSLQIALCHMFFNLIGILIWYPVPFMRKIPLGIARYLGKTTSRYRWFAFMYLIVAFFVIPMSIFGLSLLGWQVLAGVGFPILLIILCVLVLNIIQHKRKTLLPKVLQTWEFLPEFMRSLQPLDNLFGKLFSICNCSRFCPCCKFCQKTKPYSGRSISQNTTMTSFNSICDESPNRSPRFNRNDESSDKLSITYKDSPV